MSTPASAPLIGDLLVTGDRLEVWCQHADCRHEVMWTAEEAVTLLGAHTTFEEARLILVCPACRDHGRQKMIGVRASVADHYARHERRRLEQHEADYGQEQTAILRKHLEQKRL